MYLTKDNKKMISSASCLPQFDFNDSLLNKKVVIKLLIYGILILLQSITYILLPSIIYKLLKEYRKISRPAKIIVFEKFKLNTH